jgi:hypothetical protein
MQTWAVVLWLESMRRGPMKKLAGQERQMVGLEADLRHQASVTIEMMGSEQIAARGCFP